MHPKKMSENKSNRIVLARGFNFFCGTGKLPSFILWSNFLLVASDNELDA